MKSTRTLEEHLKTIRNQGYVPWINPNASKEGLTVVDAICAHGLSWWSAELVKKGDLYEWDDTDEDDEGFCEPCINHDTVICQGCKKPWPRLSDEQLVKAWDDAQNLLLSEKCSCGKYWTRWIGVGPEPSVRPAQLTEENEMEWSYDVAPKIAKVAVGRNDPCSCGSGKKYKRCCLK